jgi:Protein of unknown function (DUF3302)
MSGLDIFAIIVLIILLLTAMAAWASLGMLPGKIARSRGHPQADAINIGGWLGVLTGVLWPIFLIWAYTKPIKIIEGEGNSSELAALRNRIDALEAELAAAKVKRS